MPRGMGGYKQRTGQVRPVRGTDYHGTGKGDLNTSNRTSKKEPVRGANRHGFKANPKTNHEFRRGDGNAFPTNPGQGLRGDAGLPGSHGSHGPKGGMRSKSHKGY